MDHLWMIIDVWEVARAEPATAAISIEDEFTI
jgi:hypothetical protein